MAVGRVVTALLGAATAGTAALTAVRWIAAPTPPLLPALQAIVPAGLPAAALVTAVAAAVPRWRITATLDGLRAGGVTERLSHAAGTPAEGMSASGTLILSRYPLRNTGVRAPPALRHELPVAIVDAPSGDVLVAGVHPVSPVPRDTVVWHRELAALARWSASLVRGGG